MKLIDGKLYLTFQEAVDSGIKENTIKTAKARATKKGNSTWDFLDDPADKRRVLIGYEALSEAYRALVFARFGNPYERVARQPILEMILQDAIANDFFKRYRYDNETKWLDIKNVTKYTRAASWLNMLGTVQEDRQVIKKVLGLTVPEFYLNAGILINDEKQNGKNKEYTGSCALPGDFPATYQRLMNKVKAYKEGGYASLIAPEFGNKAAAKIGKTAEGFDPELERQMIAVIRKVASHHNNLDAAQVAMYANLVFEKNGWSTISDSRVYQIMQENKVVLTPGRRGKRAYNSELAMQHKRHAPKFPTYYWTLDGWTAELVYQNKDGYDNRLVVVVVLDAANKYPVGYAIGDRENHMLIQQALRNAVGHMNELFGGFYRPWQLQSDHYAIKKLTPFYQAVTELYIPAAVGNAKAKIIEPYFRHLNKRCQSMFPNWSGFGITSKKKNQVNSEMLDLTKKSFPDKDGVIRQIEMLMTLERSEKLAAYKEMWESMPAADKKEMDTIDWLMVFGEPVGDRTNRITGQGIIKVIGDQEITYDSFDPLFRENINTDWQIIADQQNLTHVLAVSPDGSLRFVLEQKMSSAMDVRSSTEEQRKYSSRIDKFNKERREYIIKTYVEDAEIVDEILNNTPLSLTNNQELALKLMLTVNGQQKERLQDAKKLQPKKEKPLLEAPMTQAVNFQKQQLEYLRKKTDSNKYLD